MIARRAIPRLALLLIALVLVCLLPSSALAAPLGLSPPMQVSPPMAFDPGTFGNMPAALLVAAGALAAAIVQYAKFAGLPDGNGPAAVLGVAILIVALWAAGLYQSGVLLGTPLGYLFDVMAIVTTAIGSYGLYRANNPTIATATSNIPPKGTVGDPPRLE